MDYKKVNLTLLIFVLVLSFFLICIILKALFFGNDKYEWGSFTDWISSLSTFLTLVVAWKAYKAAPQWIKEKQKEEGFNHVKTLMSEYDQIVSTIKELYYDILSIKKSDQKFNVVVESINKEMYRTLDLNYKLESCSRWDITYPQEVQTAISRLTKYYNHALMIITFKGIVTAEEPGLINDELFELKGLIEIDVQYFNKPLHEIFKFQQL